MIETIMLIVVIFVLSGVFLVRFFYQKEKKLLNRLQQMLDCAIDGELERTEVSEEKYSALENSMKQYIDSSFLAGKNQQEQKEVIQKLISDIAHQTLTPISNLKIYGEILSEVSNENQEEIATILEQTEKLDFFDTIIGQIITNGERNYSSTSGGYCYCTDVCIRTAAV